MVCHDREVMAGKDPTKVMGQRAPFWEIAGAGVG